MHTGHVADHLRLVAAEARSSKKSCSIPFILPKNVANALLYVTCLGGDSLQVLHEAFKHGETEPAPRTRNSKTSSSNAGAEKSARRRLPKGARWPPPRWHRYRNMFSMSPLMKSLPFNLVGLAGFPSPSCPSSGPGVARYFRRQRAVVCQRDWMFIWSLLQTISYPRVCMYILVTRNIFATKDGQNCA